MLNKLYHRSSSFVMVLCALCCVVYLGCAKPPDMTNSTDGGSDASTASTSLEKNVGTNSLAKPPVANQRSTNEPHTAARPAIDSDLLKVYARATAYSDTTTMRLTYRFADGREESETTVVKTRYAKPNRLHLDVSSADNRVTVMSDGKTMRARIYDPLTRDFEGQTVVVDSPDVLTVSDLYKITELLDPLAPEEMLSALLGTPTGLDMTPLGILLDEGGLVDLLSKYELTVMTDNARDRPANGGIVETINEVRVATTPDGTYRFWIDKNSGLLRRIEFPPSTTNLPPGIRQIELIAEIENERTSVSNADFVASADEQLQEVRHFVMPPLPPPTDRIGQALGRLQFANSTDQPVSIDNNSEQISVVTWFHNHPSSQMVVGQLESLRHRVEDDRVRFFNVLVEQDSESSGQPNATSVADWSLAKPPVYDTQAMGLKKLLIKQAPTTIVLGGENTLHYFGVGANPNLGNEVAVVIERLLAGQNVAEGVLQRNAEAQKAYRRHLASARAGGDGWVEELDTELHERSQPQRLKIADAWTCEDLAEPGNLLIVPGKQKLLLVVDGWNHLAVVTTNGELKKRFPLELPSDAGITLLRAGKDKRDRGLIAATTRGGRRAFVFDFGGKLLMQYPRLPDPRSVIGDVGFGDLDGDKDPELVVAWQGNQGVHGVGLNGNHRWTNGVASGIASLGLVANKGANSVFVTGEEGRPYLINGDGRTEREISLGPATIHQLVAWPGSARGFHAIVADSDLPKNSASFLGISSIGGGGVTAVGITESWQPIWKYPLPPGIYRHQVDWPQSIDLPNIGPTWLVPGADGSVHFVGADGKFTDTFYTGEHIRGIAGLNLNNRLLLILAKDGKLSGFEIEVPDEPPTD